MLVSPAAGRGTGSRRRARAPGGPNKALEPPPGGRHPARPAGVTGAARRRLRPRRWRRSPALRPLGRGGSGGTPVPLMPASTPPPAVAARRRVRDPNKASTAPGWVPPDSGAASTPPVATPHVAAGVAHQHRQPVSRSAPAIAGVTTATMRRRLIVARSPWPTVAQAPTRGQSEQGLRAAAVGCRRAARRNAAGATGRRCSPLRQSDLPAAPRRSQAPRRAAGEAWRQPGRSPGSRAEAAASPGHGAPCPNRPPRPAAVTVLATPPVDLLADIGSQSGAVPTARLLPPGPGQVAVIRSACLVGLGGATTDLREVAQSREEWRHGARVAHADRT